MVLGGRGRGALENVRRQMDFSDIGNIRLGLDDIRFGY